MNGRMRRHLYCAATLLHSCRFADPVDVSHTTWRWPLVLVEAAPPPPQRLVCRAACQPRGCRPLPAIRRLVPWRCLRGVSRSCLGLAQMCTAAHPRRRHDHNRPLLSTMRPLSSAAATHCRTACACSQRTTAPRHIRRALSTPSTTLSRDTSTPTPARLSRSARVFKPAAALADVSITVHGLRHSAASATIRQGMTPVQVSRILGHSKPSITLDVYSHEFPDDLAAIADE